jgi:hypothetical protein
MLHTLLTVSVIFLAVYGTDGAGELLGWLVVSILCMNFSKSVGVSRQEIVVRVNQTFSIKCFLPTASDGSYNFYDGDELIPNEFVTVSGGRLASQVSSFISTFRHRNSTNEQLN